MCANERWSSRQLQERINSMLFERTILSKKPEETIKNDLQKLKTSQEMSVHLAFRDPYVLDFLGLADTFSEKQIKMKNLFNSLKWTKMASMLPNTSQNFLQ